MPESVYIHIPFCKSKCKYCSFVSFIKYDTDYFSYLEKEIDTYYQGESLKTLYFGGGTPSVMEVEVVKRLVDKFNFAPDCEITFETNPDDAKLEYLKSLRDIGINRLSMGAQTFDDNILKLIGRRHCSEDTIKATDNAKLAGFENISLDLIYGLGANINKDIESLIQLKVPHISTYGLKIEEGSYFYNHLPQNLPDEDMQADMYLEINESLERAGYKRYEVSNFALPGYESRHNLNYWKNNEYYGFGVAAHGFLNGVRYSNCNTIEEYKNGFRDTEHFITPQESLEEEIFLGFRKTDGIDTSLINKKFGIDFDKKYNSVINKYSPDYIEKTPCGYKLTTQGVLLSNLILSEFLV